MKTRKLILLITALSISSFYVASAQTKFDAHVGISPARELGSQEIRVAFLGGKCNAAIRPSKQSAGITLGMGIMQTMKSGFFLRAEGQYLHSKTYYSMREIQESGERPANLTYSESSHTISLPLSVGVRLGSFRVHSGVNINAIIQSKTTLTNLGDFNDNSSPLYLGWHAGIGYDLGDIALEIRYSQDFRNYGQHYSIGEKELNFYGNRLRWTVLVKYYFG